MMDRRSPWRERLWLWLPAAAFLLLNLALLSAYRLTYVGREEVLEAELARQEARLGRVETRRRQLEAVIATARANQDRVGGLYGQRLASERQRLTRVISEVKELARRAGLEPAAISYPEEVLEDYGLVKRSLVFSVDGTYAQLRQLINLLELSDAFLTLEEVALSEVSGEGARLRIDLRISTLFARAGAAVGGQGDREGVGS